MTCLLFALLGYTHKLLQILQSIAAFPPGNESELFYGSVRFL